MVVLGGGAVSYERSTHVPPSEPGTPPPKPENPKTLVLDPGFRNLEPGAQNLNINGGFSAAFLLLLLYYSQA